MSSANPLHLVAPTEPCRGCSFCGKRAGEVPAMVSAGGQAALCSECLGLCNDIIAEEISREDAKSGRRPDARPDYRGLADGLATALAEVDPPPEITERLRAAVQAIESFLVGGAP